MKKKLCSILLGIMLFVTIFGLVACGGMPVKNFNISFVVDGNVYQTITTNENGSIKMPQNPTKDGFTFDGWFWDKDSWREPFTTKSILDSPLTFDISIYAKFIENHTHSYIEEVTAPTCTEKGFTTHTCACGSSYVDSYVNATGHSFTNYVSDGNATCLTNGTETAKCDNCDKTNTREELNSALGHSFTNYISNNDATCLIDGTKTAHCNHNGCNETDKITDVGSALGHSFTHYVSNNDATYESDGTKTAICDHFGCDETHTIVDTGSILKITVSVYIDNRLSKTIYTDATKNYKIEIPTKPEDITINPNSDKYFYGWFVDSGYNTPLTDKFSFTTNSKIYGKWITVNSNSFNYSVNKGEATITGFYNSTATIVVVPCYINSFPVTKIQDQVFYNKTMIKNLIICDGVKEIGQSAFNNCNSLQSVKIPTSVTKIDYNAFYNCTSLKRVDYQGTINEWVEINFDSVSSGANPLYYAKDLYINNEKVTSLDELESHTIGKHSFAGLGVENITIPNNVTSIGSSAFSGCSSLTSVTIGNNVTSIGNYAFSGCSSLTSVTIGNNVTSIGNYAFSGCSNLTSIEIPDNVTSIGISAFSGCSSIQSMTLPFIGGSKSDTNESNNSFGYIFGTANYTGGVATQQNYESNLVTYYIPSALKEVTITGDTIINSAFRNCSSLTSIVIRENVTSIGHYAFLNCNKLTSITIPNSVTSIGYRAFADCSSLTSIEIPSSISSIDQDAFSSCDKLEKVYYNGTIAQWVMIEFGTSISNPLYYAKQLFILNRETKKYEEVTEVNITTGTKINALAFVGYSGLTSAVIGESVTSIGDYAFYDCSSLTSVVIGDSVESIGNYAFSDCSNLTSIIYQGTKEEWNAIVKGNGWNYYTGNYIIHCTDGDISK